MKCSDVEKYLEQIAPAVLVGKDDNVGMMVGRNDKNVSRILITSRIDQSIAEMAVDRHVDLILSHDPVITDPILQVNGGSYQGRLLLMLLQNDISCFCMGSAYDCCRQSAQDWIAAKLELVGVAVVEESVRYSSGKEELLYGGSGRIGHFKQPKTLREICRKISDALGEKQLRVYAAPGKEELTATEVAIVTGNDLHVMDSASDKGAEVIIASELSGNEGIRINQKQLTVIEISGRPAESAFIECMEQYLSEVLSSEVDIITAESRAPYEVVTFS